MFYVVSELVDIEACHGEFIIVDEDGSGVFDSYEAAVRYQDRPYNGNDYRLLYQAEFKNGRLSITQLLRKVEWNGKRYEA